MSKFISMVYMKAYVKSIIIFFVNTRVLYVLQAASYPDKLLGLRW